MKICVFGASSRELAQGYYDAAYELGAQLARRGHELVFGGGTSGLMGAAARGVVSEGGRLTGVAPRFFDEPGILFEGCTDFVFTETMSERKKAMEDMSDAFVTLPGGIGTFEEFFEALTLKQLGRHAKAMAVLNTLGYYDAMEAMLVRAWRSASSPRTGTRSTPSSQTPPPCSTMSRATRPSPRTSGKKRSWVSTTQRNKKAPPVR